MDSGSPRQTRPPRTSTRNSRPSEPGAASRAQLRFLGEGARRNRPAELDESIEMHPFHCSHPPTCDREGASQTCTRVSLVSFSNSSWRTTSQCWQPTLHPETRCLAQIDAVYRTRIGAAAASETASRRVRVGMILPCLGVIVDCNLDHGVQSRRIEVSVRPRYSTSTPLLRRRHGAPQVAGHTGRGVGHQRRSALARADEL